jgi:hypothetical protein
MILKGSNTKKYKNELVQALNKNWERMMAVSILIGSNDWTIWITHPCRKRTSRVKNYNYTRFRDVGGFKEKRKFLSSKWAFSWPFI